MPKDWKVQFLSAPIQQIIRAYCVKWEKGGVMTRFTIFGYGVFTAILEGENFQKKTIHTSDGKRYIFHPSRADYIGNDEIPGILYERAWDGRDDNGEQIAPAVFEPSHNSSALEAFKKYREEA